MNEARQKWVEALRSGKYKQTQHTMFIDNKGDSQFCCLGVLCEISPIAATWKNGEVSLQKVWDWAGIDSNNIFPGMWNDFSSGQFIYLNDQLDWSFDQIADYIENYNGE